ncbi:MAG: hypothetical protein IIZ39_13570, partial [Blautia sp.]|nr:hypothetical protein [Blautia sp.]
DILLNGAPLVEREHLGNFPGEAHAEGCAFFLGEFSAGDKLSLRIDIQNSEGESLCESDLFQIALGEKDAPSSISFPEERIYPALPPNSFASRNVGEASILEEKNLSLEFGGLVKGEDGELSIRLWANNHSSHSLPLLLTELTIDGREREEALEAGIILPDKKWAIYDVPLADLTKDAYHFVSFTPAVTGLAKSKATLAKKVSMRFFFNRRIFKATVLEKEAGKTAAGKKSAPRKRKAKKTEE